MKPITSIADFYIRVSKNDWYKKLIIYAHLHSNWGPAFNSNYESAIDWMENWAKRSVGPNNTSKTCRSMATYLNDCVNKMKIAGEKIPEE